MKSKKLSRRAHSAIAFALQPLEPRQLLSAAVNQTVSTTNLAAGSTASLTLSNFFKDNAITAGDTVVDLNTNAGHVPIELTNAATPATVANFLSYVANGYANTIIHRDAPGFVIQGGGYTTAGTHITTNGNVTGESATATLKNTTGTIAMALSSGPNSGTSEFFLNLTNSPFLDDTSDGGPFTAFGKVIYNGMNVVNSIAALGQVNASAENGALNTLPVNANYTGPTGNSSISVLPVANANPVPAADLVTLNPVVLANSGLTFSATSANPALVTASIANGVLTITPAAGAASGNTSVTVTATDLGGGQISQVIPVVYTAAVSTGGTLTPTGITFQAVAGQAYAASVGSFTSSDTSATPGQFTAIIDYGDTGGSAGTVVQTSPGVFSVLGGHGYSTAGTDNVTVTITGPNSTSTVIHSTATVTAGSTGGTGGGTTGSAPTLTANPITFNPVAGQAYAATVGGFTSSDTTLKATDFTATINYGDTGGSAGTVVQTAPGVFSVVGGHGFTAGTYNVVATITGPGGSTTSVHSTAQVGGTTGTATLTPIGLTFHPKAGQAYAATVGSFSTTDLSATASQFTAFIDYGDTGGYAGNIFQTAPGVFSVVGGHGYNAGNFNVKVTVTGPGGPINILSTAAVT